MSESCITKIYIPKIVRENMLYLIGLGLRGDDIPYSGIKALKNAVKFTVRFIPIFLVLKRRNLRVFLE